MNNLISFKGDPGLKKMLVEEIMRHKKLDQIVQGTYGDPKHPEKGFCAVGCSITSINDRLGKDYSCDDHSVYEIELGIPEWLARLEDRIFECLTNGEAKLWPERFTKAIPVGVNLEPVKWKFCAFILKENIDRVLSLDISDELKKQVVDAIRQCLDLHQEAIETGKWDESAASAARSAAWSAAWSAENAAWSAESAARSAAWSAAWSAESAARSAWSAASASSVARSAAESAESAADSAAWSADSAAWSAAWRAAYERYAKKLLRLLRAAK